MPWKSITQQRCRGLYHSIQRNELYKISSERNCWLHRNRLLRNEASINSIGNVICCDSSKAQNKADIEVSYEAHHPNLRNSKDDLTSQYIACQLWWVKVLFTKNRVCRFAQFNTWRESNAEWDDAECLSWGKFGRYSRLRLTKFGDILELKIRKVFEFNFHSQESPFGWMKRIKKTFQHKIRVKFKLS